MTKESMQFVGTEFKIELQVSGYGKEAHGPSAVMDKERLTTYRRYCIKATRKALREGCPNITEKLYSDGRWQKRMIKQRETLTTMWDFQRWYDHQDGTADTEGWDPWWVGQHKYSGRHILFQKNKFGGDTVPNNKMLGLEKLLADERAAQMKARDENAGTQPPPPPTQPPNGVKHKGKGKTKWEEPADEPSADAYESRWHKSARGSNRSRDDYATTDPTAGSSNWSCDDYASSDPYQTTSYPGSYTEQWESEADDKDDD